ncbi:ABC transporter ATP-binding protein [Pseudonocardia aurantiaca]|uniref:ABC transporter ATP-binding protein n=1 Tax=Pseudonocardia aurantiaca TaxID=75290 RepID=A0ABW4FED8_9PSEU
MNDPWATAAGGVNEPNGRVTVSELSKSFGPVNAVDGLTFTVEPGAVTGFLGPNGSGKTTTLRMVLGLVTPTAGEARINGMPFAELANPARVVGAVLEAQGFHPARTARKHLLACAAAIGVPDASADHVLGTVGLLDAGDRKVGGYSLGMRQRLALAVALLGDPQVLVLDEPGNGLDPEGIAWMRAFLRGFARQGRSVLVSSHLLAEVEQTADHLVVISRGRCVFQGSLAQLQSSRRARVLVRCAAPDRLADALARTGVLEIDTLPEGWLGIAGADPVHVGDVALGAGVAIYGMVHEKIDLEQLFFQLTAQPWEVAHR